MPDRDDLLELAMRLAGRAGPGEEVEVYVARGVETDVRAYDGDVEALSQAASAGVGVRVVVDHRQGFATAGSLDGDAIERALGDARENAGFATPDPNVGLVAPDGVAPPALDLWDDGLGALSTDDKVKLAIELEQRVRADPRIRQVSSADYGDVATEAAVASSLGVRATARRTFCTLSVSVIAGEGADSHTGSGLTFARGPDALDPDHAATDAIERSTRLLGAAQPPSTTCPVVLDPRVASTLLAVVAGAMSGEAVTKGRSMFAGRVGETIGVAGLSVVDDPTDARSMGAARNDAEGLACRPNMLIDDGVLRGFVYDSVAGRRAGMASTGSAVRGGYATTPVAGCRAVALAPGPLPADEVLTLVGDGLYVQSVTGVHSGVNAVSGDFSVGAEGLMIRGGALAEPVRQVTIASTLQRMLQSVLAIGADVQWLPGLAAGQTLAIDAMTLSGA